MYNLNIYKIIRYPHTVIHTHTHKHLREKHVVFIFCVDVMEYYSAIEKNVIPTSAKKWMELVIIMLTEISQTQNGCM